MKCTIILSYITLLYVIIPVYHSFASNTYIQIKELSMILKEKKIKDILSMCTAY